MDDFKKIPFKTKYFLFMKLFPLTSWTTDELRIFVILVFYRNSSVSIHR